MTRIEWTRYGGADVEAVVAMLVNRKRPNSIRITPSRGDGGVDILDPRPPRKAAGDAVLQVKAFTGPLTSSQKTQILDSLDALRRDPRWADLAVTEWRLVTPWDPTPEALAWLQAEGKSRELDPQWDGLTDLDNWAAEFPEVIDYYMHGGAERINRATEALTQLLQGQRNERLAASGNDPLLPGQGEGRLSPGDVVEELRALVVALDTDPHYRYDIEVGGGEMPRMLLTKPGLVSTVFVDQDQRWAKVDIIARCAASVTERPLSFEVTLRAEPGSDNERRLRDFHTYGAGFASPMDAANLAFDLPGQLGGQYAEGQVLLGPVAEDVSDDTELRAEVLDPGGTCLALVHLQRVERTQGIASQGIRALYREENGAFTLEWRTLLADMSSSLAIAPSDVTGEPVAKVGGAVRFRTLLKHPNALRISRRYAPAATGGVQPIPEQLNSPATGEEGVTARLVEALAVVQEHVPEVIRLPDLTQTTCNQARSWLAAAALLRGDRLTLAVPAVPIGLPADSELPGPGTLVVVAQPFELEVGGQRLTLGQYYLAAEAGETSPLPGNHGDDIVGVQVAVPSGQVSLTYRHPGEEQPPSS